MPTVVLANNIGQPTNEVQAQTQKVRFSPVTVNKDGGITPAKELPVLPDEIKPLEPTLEAAVETVEPPKTEVKAPDVKKMQDEERFQALARREKAMRNKIRESEAELAKYKAQATELEQAKLREEQYKSEAQKRDERLKTDPIGFLTEQGYTTDQITQAMLNQPGPESQMIKALSEKIARLEESQQKEIERQQKDATENYNNALKTIQRNVDSLVASNPEFETIKASEAQKSVTNYIEKVWKAEGIMLDVEDAAKEIEDYLTDQAINLAKLKKVQGKLKPAAPAAPKAAVPAPAATAKPVTLTNKVAQNTRPLSARERAILAFKRELK